MKVGQKLERLPGYTFRNSSNYKMIDGYEYQQVTYRKHFDDKNNKQSTFKFNVLPDYAWK